MTSMTKRAAAVIFDMDGLMFDTERIAQIVWEQAAEQFGYQTPSDAFLGVIGKARPDVEIYTRHIEERINFIFDYLPPERVGAASPVAGNTAIA